jgi:hypothetical protein
MLNDMRREVKELRPKVEKLAVTAEDVAQKVDKHLPKILAESEQAGKTINTNLPPLVKRSEDVLARSETAEDTLIDLSENFKLYRDVMGAAHAGSQNKSLFAYGTSILNLVGRQPNAKIGVKRPGANEPLRQPVPAKEWASAAQKDAYLLSLGAKTKEDVLAGLARSRSPAPLHIQFGSQLPRLLGDWIREMHKDES